jgi:hypothetical protein
MYVREEMQEKMMVYVKEMVGPINDPLHHVH